jgi:ATP-dependent Lon protease
MMAEAELRRTKDAQLEFPHAPNHRNMVNPSHTNGGVGFQRQTQQQNAHYHQHHNSRASPSVSHSSVSSKGKMSQSMMGASVNEHSEGSSVIHPTPMFQRLVSDGVQELKAYTRIIETQNRRLSELEAVHRDLETRLEVQSNRRLELEKTLEDREHLWTEQIAEIKKERDYWQELVNEERKMNARLQDQLLRKDQDIHRMLSRKVRYSYQKMSSCVHALHLLDFLLYFLVRWSSDVLDTKCQSAQQ